MDFETDDLFAGVNVKKLVVENATEIEGQVRADAAKYNHLGGYNGPEAVYNNYCSFRKRSSALTG
jgi:hypothetical protein